MALKKTHSQFINEITQINPNITVIGKYKSSKDHILCKCNICGNEWSPTPSKLLEGRSCPKCARVKVGLDRRNTFEDFISRLSLVNKDIEPKGEYNGADSPIECVCKKCGHIWFPTPSNLYAGKGCPKCSRVYRRTKEDFYIEMSDLHPAIKILGEYEGTKNHIECECTVCGYIWQPIAESLLRGVGCPQCTRMRINPIKVMTKKQIIVDNMRRKTLTKAQYFEARLHDDYPNIILNTSYIKSNSRVSCSCTICGYQWEPFPNNLLKNGCPQCANRRKTNSFFVAEIANLNMGIELLSEYTGAHNPIDCKCLVCGHKWSPTAHSLLQGHGCPQCANNNTSQRLRKTHSQFVKELEQINPDIEVIGTYSLNNVNIDCLCRNCNYRWSPLPSDILLGKGCPKCNGRRGTSFIEQLIFVAFAEELGYEKVINRDKNAIGYELDIFIPTLKLAIEPGSWKWHKNSTQRDELKRNLCADSGIRLITIYDSYSGTQILSPDDDYYTYSFDLGTESGYLTIKTLLENLFEQYDIDNAALKENFSDYVLLAKRNARRRNTNDFIKQVHEINPAIEVLGEFTRVHDKIECKCSVCGYVWETEPSGLLGGAGCPRCGGSYKKTHEEFLEQLESINPNVIVLEQYTNDSTNIRCECRLCGHQWSPSPSSLIQKHGCPKCAKIKASQKRRKTHSQFVEELEQINPHIQINGTYKNARTKIQCKCLICGYEWETIPDSLLRGTGCKKCALRKSSILNSKSHNCFIKQLSEVNNNIEVVGSYKNSKTKILCRCLKCGYEWNAYPSNLLRGHGCRKCADVHKKEKRY